MHCAELTSELEWFGWEGGKTMNRKRAVACFQDAETEDDFQKLFGRSESKREGQGCML